ncbi:MAG: hypothetical protein M0Q95_03775 [Porticoccaceae bacterium]|nr:hypothetical protein [Porticoccaceae bacterium]
MRCVPFVAALWFATAPVLAFEIEEIGRIQATFDGETIVQPTVIARDGDEASATAFLMYPGGGMSSFSLAGYSADNKRLGIEVSYMTEQLSLQSVPVALTITYAPQGGRSHWTSEDAPIPPRITFSTLDVNGEQGRAIGSFTAVLCFAKDYEVGVDPAKCRPMEGSFETTFVVEN